MQLASVTKALNQKKKYADCIMHYICIISYHKKKLEATQIDTNKKWLLELRYSDFFDTDTKND